MKPRARTLGELKAIGYEVLSVKEEMRRNLIEKLRRRERLFPGIIGFDDTVIPQIVNAILAKHDMILLGLRGQAKNAHRPHAGELPGRIRPPSLPAPRSTITPLLRSPSTLPTSSPKWAMRRRLSGSTAPNATARSLLRQM
jgi:hypothetical protein